MVDFHRYCSTPIPSISFFFPQTHGVSIAVTVLIYLDIYKFIIIYYVDYRGLYSSLPLSLSLSLITQPTSYSHLLIVPANHQ